MQFLRRSARRKNARMRRLALLYKPELVAVVDEPQLVEKISTPVGSAGLEQLGEQKSDYHPEGIEHSYAKVIIVEAVLSAMQVSGGKRINGIGA